MRVDLSPDHETLKSLVVNSHPIATVDRVQMLSDWITFGK